MEKKYLRPKEKAKLMGHSPEVQNKILPIIDSMASSTDPQGSYTGVPVDNPHEKPVQDADDL